MFATNVSPNRADCTLQNLIHIQKSLPALRGPPSRLRSPFQELLHKISSLSPIPAGPRKVASRWYFCYFVMEPFIPS